MFNVKRILSLGLAVGLIMAVAAGCGGNETKLSEAEQALLKDNDKRSDGFALSDSNCSAYFAT